VNLIAAHDGFTTSDLVTYNEKHNEANGEDNLDGISDNRSWNCGVEGPIDDPDLNVLRVRQIKKLMSTLMLSQGTPLLVAGDEIGRTQQGNNNNAYCQGNEISWINWDLQIREKGLLRFVQKLARTRHKFPILRRGRFYTAFYNEQLGIKDLTCVNASGQEMQERDWTDSTRCFGMLMDGRSQKSGIQRPSDDATLLLVINGHHDLVEFTLPSSYGGEEWALLIDTNLEVTDNCTHSTHKTGMQYEVTGRSLLLLALISRNAQRENY
jgi:glycogen operon protein